MKREEATEEAEENDLARTVAEHFGGYHRCRLGGSVRLEYVSDNLCAMLGYGKHELAGLIGEPYTALVYPDDTRAFERFARRLARKEGCESATYRLIKRDGTVIQVVDTMASIRVNDGCMRGYSIVCEIPGDQATMGQYLPGKKVAVVKVSGGSSPTITQMRGLAEDFLSIDAEPEDLRLMDFVAIDDKDKVAGVLRRAYRDGSSGMESCTIVSADGNGTKCNLWAERIDDNGRFEDSSFFVKVEVGFGYQEALSVGKALFSSFAEDVFEIDRVENSAKYICQSGKVPIAAPLNVRLNADDFLGWFLEHVSPWDRGAVRKFCTDAKTLKKNEGNGNPVSSKIRFEMGDESGFDTLAALVVVPVSDVKCFMCLNSDSVSIESGIIRPTEGKTKHIDARLFGSFSLSVDGEAVFIKHDKARELLALMIERRGAFLTAREAITSLWECEPDDFSRRRYRKAAFRLMEDLRKNGIGYIVENDRGARRVIPEYIECDYYDYLDGAAEPSGGFLPEYSWSEFVGVV